MLMTAWRLRQRMRQLLIIKIIIYYLYIVDRIKPLTIIIIIINLHPETHIQHNISVELRIKTPIVWVQPLWVSEQSCYWSGGVQIKLKLSGK